MNEEQQPISDWFLEMSAGNIQNLKETLNSGYDFELLPKEKYQESEGVQQMFTDKDGNFNQKNFDDFYKNAKDTYQRFNEAQTDIAYTTGAVDTPFTRAVGLKTTTKAFEVEYNADPYRRARSVANFNDYGDKVKTAHEIAQPNKVYDAEMKKWSEHSAESLGMLDAVTNPKVLATWEQDGTHVNRNGDTIQHKRGEFRTNEDDKFFYEYLGNKQYDDRTHPEHTLSAFNVITNEDSALNKYDFFDSDDVKKSLMGNLVKTTAQIIPYFTPAKGVYAGIQAIVNGGEALAVLGSAVGDVSGKKGGIFDYLDKIRATSNALSVTTDEYTQQNPFSSIGGYLNLTTSIVGQLSQQGVINQVFGGIDYLAKTKMIGKAAANAYMTATSAQSIYEEGEKMGLPEKDRALLYMGALPLLSAIMVSDIGSHMIKQPKESNAILNSELRRLISPTIDTYKEQLSQLAKTAGRDSKAYQEGVKWVGAKLGENVAGKFASRMTNGVLNSIDDLINPQQFNKELGTLVTNSLNQYKGAFIAESAEELSELGVELGLKSIYNTLVNQGYTQETEKVKKKFNFDNLGEQILATAFAGGLGGAIGKGMREIDSHKMNQEVRDIMSKNGTGEILMNYLSEGKINEVRNAIDELYNNGNLGSKKLSSKFIAENNHPEPYNKNNPNDLSIADATKNILLNNVQYYQSLRDEFKDSLLTPEEFNMIDKLNIFNEPLLEDLSPHPLVKQLNDTVWRIDQSLDDLNKEYNSLSESDKITRKDEFDNKVKELYAKRTATVKDYQIQAKDSISEMSKIFDEQLTYKDKKLKDMTESELRDYLKLRDAAFKQSKIGRFSTKSSFQYDKMNKDELLNEVRNRVRSKKTFSNLNKDSIGKAMIAKQTELLNDIGILRNELIYAQDRQTPTADIELKLKQKQNELHSFKNSETFANEVEKLLLTQRYDILKNFKNKDGGVLTRQEFAKVMFKRAVYDLNNSEQAQLDNAYLKYLKGDTTFSNIYTDVKNSLIAYETSKQQYTGNNESAIINTIDNLSKQKVFQTALIRDYLFGLEGDVKDLNDEQLTKFAGNAIDRDVFNTTLQSISNLKPIGTNEFEIPTYVPIHGAKLLFNDSEFTIDTSTVPKLKDNEGNEQEIDEDTEETLINYGSKTVITKEQLKKQLETNPEMFSKPKQLAQLLDYEVTDNLSDFFNQYQFQSEVLTDFIQRAEMQARNEDDFYDVDENIFKKPIESFLKELEAIAGLIEALNENRKLVNSIRKKAGLQILPEIDTNAYVALRNRINNYRSKLIHFQNLHDKNAGDQTAAIKRSDVVFTVNSVLSLSTLLKSKGILIPDISKIKQVVDNNDWLFFTAPENLKNLLELYEVANNLEDSFHSNREQFTDLYKSSLDILLNHPDATFENRYAAYIYSIYHQSGTDFRIAMQKALGNEGDTLVPFAPIHPQYIALRVTHAMLHDADNSIIRIDQPPGFGKTSIYSLFLRGFDDTGNVIAFASGNRQIDTLMAKLVKSGVSVTKGGNLNDFFDIFNYTPIPPDEYSRYITPTFDSIIESEINNFTIPELPSIQNKIFIFDEGSNISALDLMRLSRIAKANNAKIIISGDKTQLGKTVEIDKGLFTSFNYIAHTDQLLTIPRSDISLRNSYQNFTKTLNAVNKQITAYHQLEGEITQLTTQDIPAELYVKDDVIGSAFNMSESEIVKVLQSLPENSEVLFITNEKKEGDYDKLIKLANRTDLKVTALTDIGIEKSVQGYESNYVIQLSSSKIPPITALNYINTMLSRSQKAFVTLDGAFGDIQSVLETHFKLKFLKNYIHADKHLVKFQSKFNENTPEGKQIIDELLHQARAIHSYLVGDDAVKASAISSLSTIVKTEPTGHKVIPTTSTVSSASRLEIIGHYNTYKHDQLAGDHLRITAYSYSSSNQDKKWRDIKDNVDNIEKIIIKQGGATTTPYPAYYAIIRGKEYEIASVPKVETLQQAITNIQEILNIKDPTQLTNVERLVFETQLQGLLKVIAQVEQIWKDFPKGIEVSPKQLSEFKENMKRAPKIKSKKLDDAISLDTLIKQFEDKNVLVSKSFVVTNLPTDPKDFNTSSLGRTYIMIISDFNSLSEAEQIKYKKIFESNDIQEYNKLRKEHFANSNSPIQFLPISSSFEQRSYFSIINEENFNFSSDYSKEATRLTNLISTKEIKRTLVAVLDKVFNSDGELLPLEQIYKNFGVISDISKHDAFIKNLINLVSSIEDLDGIEYQVKKDILTFNLIEFGQSIKNAAKALREDVDAELESIYLPYQSKDTWQAKDLGDSLIAFNKLLTIGKDIPSFETLLTNYGARLSLDGISDIRFHSTFADRNNIEKTSKKSVSGGAKYSEIAFVKNTSKRLLKSFVTPSFEMSYNYQMPLLNEIVAVAKIETSLPPSISPLPPPSSSTLPPSTPPPSKKKDEETKKPVELEETKINNKDLIELFSGEVKGGTKEEIISSDFALITIEDLTLEEINSSSISNDIDNPYLYERFVSFVNKTLFKLAYFDEGGMVNPNDIGVRFKQFMGEIPKTKSSWFMLDAKQKRDAIVNYFESISDDSFTTKNEELELYFKQLFKKHFAVLVQTQLKPFIGIDLKNNTIFVKQKLYTRSEVNFDDSIIDATTLVPDVYKLLISTLSTIEGKFFDLKYEDTLRIVKYVQNKMVFSNEPLINQLEKALQQAINETEGLDKLYLQRFRDGLYSETGFFNRPVVDESFKNLIAVSFIKTFELAYLHLSGDETPTLHKEDATSSLKFKFANETDSISTIINDEEIVNQMRTIKILPKDFKKTKLNVLANVDNITYAILRLMGDENPSTVDIKIASEFLRTILNLAQDRDDVLFQQVLQVVTSLAEDADTKVNVISNLINFVAESIGRTSITLVRASEVTGNKFPSFSLYSQQNTLQIKLNTIKAMINEGKDTPYAKNLLLNSKIQFFLKDGLKKSDSRVSYTALNSADTWLYDFSVWRQRPAGKTITKFGTPADKGLHFSIERDVTSIDQLFEQEQEFYDGYVNSLINTWNRILPKEYQDILLNQPNLVIGLNQILSTITPAQFELWYAAAMQNAIANGDTEFIYNPPMFVNGVHYQVVNGKLALKQTLLESHAISTNRKSFDEHISNGFHDYLRSLLNTDNIHAHLLDNKLITALPIDTFESWLASKDTLLTDEQIKKQFTESGLKELFDYYIDEVSSIFAVSQLMLGATEQYKGDNRTSQHIDMVKRSVAQLSSYTPFITSETGTPAREYQITVRNTPRQVHTINGEVVEKDLHDGQGLQDYDSHLNHFNSIGGMQGGMLGIVEKSFGNSLDLATGITNLQKHAILTITNEQMLNSIGAIPFTTLKEKFKC